ncbi:MAG: type II toxin-antitoxin system ParD family antitoxin [Chloroflexaceae bacterium]|nr:type II toxin-antitoxin system ParD family antitoxin [Chloroflexaceae bacterium]
MSIRLTPEQERFIESKLQAGKYHSAEEVVEIALRLLDEYDREETRWNEEVQVKIEEAIQASTQRSPIDGETFINAILDRFSQMNQA